MVVVSGNRGGVGAGTGGSGIGIDIEMMLIQLLSCTAIASYGMPYPSILVGEPH